jgi:hypothetical protein
MVPPGRPIEVVSLLLSVLLVLIASALTYWLARERRHRDPVLSGPDANHFLRQDFRRGLVSFLLVLLAIGIVVGSRVEHRDGGRMNPRFVLIWLGVFVTIAFLLLLALFDWLSTRLYARRHFRALVRERLKILREEIRQGSTPDEDGAGPGTRLEDSLPS